MASKLSVFLILVVLVTCASAQTMITDCTGLQNMKNNLAGNYELANDIDCSATVGWNGGAGFEPVGNGTILFAGAFMGSGHLIFNLTINRPSMDSVGLFGAAAANSEITMVGLEGVNIVGQIRVGGLAGAKYGPVSNSHVIGSVSSSSAALSQVGLLVGHNLGLSSSVTNCYSMGTATGFDEVGGLVGFHQFGTISSSFSEASVTSLGGRTGGLVGNNRGIIINSYATGDVMGSGDQVGGLAGRSTVEASISSCYATGSVTGLNNHVGGLVGWNTNIITTSYAVGSVSGLSNVGGLLGIAGSGSAVSQSYWDTETSGTLVSDGGVGKTTAQMQQQATFSGWNFNTNWYIEAGQDYPHLRTPYPRTCKELQYISLSQDVELAQNIHCAETLAWNAAAGFVPLGRSLGGSSLSSFSGVFKGNGYLIIGITISRATESDVGLFALLSGRVENLGVINVSVTGDRRVGALVGQLESGGAIDDCFTTGQVTGFQDVGGLVGRQDDAVVQNTYSECAVVASSALGGLIGRLNQFGIVSNSYAVGVVSGSATTGGLVGISFGSAVNSYWDTQTSTQPNSAGGQGKTSAEMQMLSTFIGWNFADTWWIDEGNAAPVLRIFLVQEQPPQVGVPSKSPSPSVTPSQSLTPGKGAGPGGGSDSNTALIAGVTVAGAIASLVVGAGIKWYWERKHFLATHGKEELEMKNAVHV